MQNLDQYKIILFDGHCNLCNGAVQFFIKFNKSKSLFFASLQSELGQSILRSNNLETVNFNSFVYYNCGQIYLRSSAALQAAKQLNFPIKLLFVFLIVPKFIRDFFYNLIAKNRYKWFGKKEECWLPTKELKDRFLD